MSPTCRTEPAVHGVAAFGDERKLLELTLDSQRGCVEERIDCATSATDRLTHPAPARPRGDRCIGDPIAHCLAQASTSQFHTTPCYDSRCLCTPFDLTERIAKTRSRVSTGVPRTESTGTGASRIGAAVPGRAECPSGTFRVRRVLGMGASSTLNCPGTVSPQRLPRAARGRRASRPGTDRLTPALFPHRGLSHGCGDLSP